MNTRSTLLMFALSIGALWLFGLMLAYKRTNVEEGLILPSLKKVPDAEIDALILQYREEGRTQDLEFYQEGGSWTFGQNKIRVDSFRIKKILDELRTAVKNDEERVPAANGTDKPRIVVIIKARGRRDMEVKIGNATNEQSFHFVKTSELPQVVAVAHSQIETLFFPDINQFRSHQPFDFVEANVKRIDIKQAGDAAKKEPVKELEIKKTDDDLWKVLVPKEFGYAAAEGPKKEDKGKDNKLIDFKKDDKEVPAGVNMLLAGIKSLHVDDEDFVPPFKEINLAGYGLEDAKEQLRIEIGTAAGLGKEEAKDVILMIGNKVPDKDKYFARMAGDLGVFKLSGKSLEVIRKAVNNPEELRSRDIVFTNVDKFDLVRIKDKKEYLLAHPAGASWSMFADGKWVKANESAVKTLLEAVGKKGAIVDFPSKLMSDAELGLDQPRMSLFLTADARPKDQKKPEAKKEEKKDEGKKDDKAKAEDKFAIDVEPGVLERKDWSTEAVVKTKAASVSPLDDKQTLVTAEVVDGKVKFTQKIDATDKEDKTVDFKVLGGKDGKEEVVVKVTVRRKPTVTLIFGKLQSKKVNDKEVWSVKRILEDGTEHRFYLAKDLVDKIVLDDVYLAYLDNDLPRFSDDDVTTFTLQRTLEKKQETLQLYRTRTEGWLFKTADKNADPSENVADAFKVLGDVNILGKRLTAKKWVQQIDDKTDLKPFGLDAPALTVTMTVKKVQPQIWASIVGYGAGAGLDNVFASGEALNMTLLACGESLKWGQAEDKGGQIVTVRFGKEGKKDNVEGVYALFTVQDIKDAKDAKDVKKEDRPRTNDLLFLVDSLVLNHLKKQQYHDRSEAVARQVVLDARAVAAGQPGLLAYGTFLNPALLDFDASKVEKVAIDARGKEVRDFVFVRDQKAPAENKENKDNKAPAENKENKDKDGKDKDGKDKDGKDKDGKDKGGKDKDGKDKDKESKTKETKEKSGEPVSLKGQTWKDQKNPAYPENGSYNLDSEKVNKLLEKMARVETDNDKSVVVRLASYGDGPRAYQKLGAKEAVIRMVLSFEGKQPPITLLIGAQIVTPKGEFRFAHSSARPQEVFLVHADFIDEILNGTNYFGKPFED